MHAVMTKNVENNRPRALNFVKTAKNMVDDRFCSLIPESVPLKKIIIINFDRFD